MKELFPIIPVALGIVAFLIAIIARIKHQISVPQIERLDPLSVKRVSIDNIRNALEKLKSYALKIHPDNIIGLNMGGVMIAASIALKIDIPTERFARCLVTEKGNRIECDNSKLEGVAIIIDDISRSGITMRASVEYFKENFKGLSKIYTACLVSHVNEKNEASYENLDFSVFITQNNNLLLPWTPKKKVKRDLIYTEEYFVNNIKNVPIETLAHEVETTLKRT